MSPMVEQATDREAAMLYVVDATEQKALEVQFAQSSKMEAVGKLAGGIAHDFNNVLTAIIGYSDLLLQTHAMSDPAYKDIKNIQGSAYRAAGMVPPVLSFSRQQTLQAEALLLDDVINENTAMLRTSLGEKDHAQGAAVARSLVRQSRQERVLARHRQPDRQCGRCHGRRRFAVDQIAQT